MKGFRIHLPQGEWLYVKTLSIEFFLMDEFFVPARLSISWSEKCLENTEKILKQFYYCT